MPRAQLSLGRSQGVPAHRAAPRGLPRVHDARPECLKGHLATNSHPEGLGSAESPLRTAPARAQAQRSAPARRASPARGESGSPLTPPTRRHWKSFRTSSQLGMSSLRADPTRAKRRRQQQPARQAGESIIGVLVAPSHAVDPTAPARPALQALENARRSRFPEGASWRRALRGRSGTPASPGGTWLSPGEPRGWNSRVLQQSAARSPSPAGASWRSPGEENGWSRTEPASIRLWPPPR